MQCPSDVNFWQMCCVDYATVVPLFVMYTRVNSAITMTFFRACCLIEPDKRDMHDAELKTLRRFRQQTLVLLSLPYCQRAMHLHGRICIGNSRRRLQSRHHTIPTMIQSYYHLTCLTLPVPLYVFTGGRTGSITGPSDDMVTDGMIHIAAFFPSR